LDDEFYKLPSSPGIITTIRQKEVEIYKEYCRREMRNTEMILVGRPEGKYTSGKN
jgi:hypothetical protein